MISCFINLRVTLSQCLDLPSAGMSVSNKICYEQIIFSFLMLLYSVLTTLLQFKTYKRTMMTNKSITMET